MHYLHGKQLIEISRERHSSHVHLSDNQGTDNHLPVGLGTIDFEEFFESLDDFKGISTIEGWAPQETDHFLTRTREKLQGIWENRP